MVRKRLAWLPWLALLVAAGCGGANQADSEGRIVSPKLPGSSVASPTAGATTGGEEGGTETGGTGTGGTEEGTGEPDPALVMHIINSALN